MWTIGTCPNTVLLSTTSECVYEWQHWRWLLLGILHKVWCRPVCSPGSWSGRGWLPLILVWHRTVVGLSCSYCEAHLKRTTNPLCGVLYKSLIIILLLLYIHVPPLQVFNMYIPWKNWNNWFIIFISDFPYANAHLTTKMCFLYLRAGKLCKSWKSVYPLVEKWIYSFSTFA